MLKLYNQLPKPLRDFINDYIKRCLIKGGNDMDYLNLTEEERSKLRQEWLSMYSTEEFLASRSPSEVLSNYSPSELLSYILRDKIVENLSIDQLTALSKMVNSRIKVQ